MNLNMGSQTFANVEIPLLWGKRAILEDEKGRISIILLEGDEAVLEVLGNKPAPDVQHELMQDGFIVIANGQELYSFAPENRVITGISLNLPECEIRSNGIRIGNSVLSGNAVVGFGVGIAVNEQGFGMGAPLPAGLAKLVV